MKKTVFLVSLFLLLGLSLVLAHGEEGFAEAEVIIESKLPCDSLTDEQLELVGDYYMAQMHPGEAHEIMDERMGGEGSESLRQMHIGMARSFYCGEYGAMSSGMMNMMMGRGGMMSGGMMDFSGSENNVRGENMVYGMMDGGMMMGGGIYGMGVVGIIYFALAAFLFSVIFWLTHNWLIKGKRR